MDPGTIIAVVQISAKLVTVCHEYILGVKNAPREISRILDEVTSVRNVVEQLIKSVDLTGNTPSSSYLSDLNRPDGPFKKCLAELTDLDNNINPARNSRLLSSKWTWPLRQRETEARLAALATIKSSLQLALTADNVQALSEIRLDTKAIPAVQKQMSELANNYDITTFNESKERQIEELGGRDQSQRHRMHYEKRMHATGDWLLSNESYLTWIETAGSILWLSGMAGCGKTVLCANIIENIKQLCTKDSAAMLYFYVDGSESLPLDEGVLNRTFLTQLVKQLPRDKQKFRYEDPVAMAKDPLSYLRMALKEIDRLYVLVDGLDECEDSIGLQGAIEFLVKTMLLAKDKIHVLTTSRTSAYARMEITDVEVTEIVIGECKDNNDLEVLLRSRLQNDIRFKRWPKTLKDELETTLLSKAQGSIHWTVCQLNSLKNCKNSDAVQTNLRNLPKTLESYYIRELSRLEDTHGASLRNVFRWIACSLRPVSVSELAAAVSVNVEDGDQPFVDENLVLFDIPDFLDSCSCFVTVYSSREDSSDERHDLLMFTHFSVLEFLRGDAIKRQSCSRFWLAQNVVHSLLAKSCMAVIRECALSPLFHDLQPLQRYAARFWLQHKLRSRSTDWSSKDVQQNLFEMFDSSRPFFAQWQGVSSIDRPWIERDSTEDDGHPRLTPLYSAALFGLSNVTKKLLENGESANAKQGIYGHALQAASAGGHLETVQILIKARAKIDAKGGRFGSAIAAAAANGHREIVIALLEKRADVQPSRWTLTDRRDDPLYMAVKHGHLEICKILLEHGAEDFYSPKGSPCTALHSAVLSGRVDIVQVMLQYDRVRKANHKGSFFGEGFRVGLTQSREYAASNGRKDLFRELMKYGISDTDLLNFSARLGEEDLFVKAMTSLAERNDADERPRGSKSLQFVNLSALASWLRARLAQGLDSYLEYDLVRALEASVRGGNFEFAEVLVQAGARIDGTRDSYYSSTPMWTAISLRVEDFMDFFIAYGADLSYHLHKAAAHGRFDDFKFIHDFGARLDYRLTQKSGPGMSMLQTASFGGSLAIVQYLFDHGADPVERTQTLPLVEAIRRRDWPMVELLLSHGADVNTPQEEYRDQGGHSTMPIYSDNWLSAPTPETALLLAIEARNEHLAKELLQRGAWPCPQTPSTVGTPLLYALHWKMNEVVQLLIDGGADVNKNGTIFERGKACFPLMIAAETGNTQLVMALLEKGASVNQQDSEGFSALHLAARCPNAAVLKMLIQDYGANTNLCLENGSRPIHSAATRGTTEHVKILLDSGEDINVRNYSGRTPLHWAAEWENVEIVELLLERGADANLKADDAQLTPLDLASVSNDRPWAQHLSGRPARTEEDKAKMRSRLKKAMISKA